MKPYQDPEREAWRRRFVLCAAAAIDGWFTAHDVLSVLRERGAANLSPFYVAVEEYMRIWYREGLLERQKGNILKIRGELDWNERSNRLFYRWIE